RTVFTLTTDGAARSAARTIALRRSSAIVCCASATACAFAAGAASRSASAIATGPSASLRAWNASTAGGSANNSSAIQASLRTLSLRNDVSRTLRQLLPVRQERLESLVRQRVADQLVQHLRRDRGDVRTQQGSFDHVHRVPDRGDQHFRVEVVVVVDLHDLCDQIHAVLADVIEPPDERRDVGRTRLGG